MNLIGQHKEVLDTPALWVDLVHLENNIAHLAAFFREAKVGWRPHMKGVKIPAIAHKVIAAGALGVTCAKLSEAEVMAICGIQDILIANQIVGPIKIRRLVQLCRRVDVKIAVDNGQNIAELSAAAVDAGVEIGVLVDVNTGMNRTGVLTIEDAVAMSELVHHSPGLRYLGLMAWEGQAVPMQDQAAKTETITQAVGMLAAAADRCRNVGLPVSIVSGGGSGTYKVSSLLGGLTEIQAGGAIFNDAAYTSWGVTTEPALFVKATVTSRPTPQRVIIDAGFKALPSHYARPIPVGMTGVSDYSSSAEHGIIALDQPQELPQVGETLDLILGYTDATLFLHDRLYGVRHDVIEVVWDIVGRGKLT